MAWAAFTADFDWRPPAEARVTIAYHAGMRCAVTRDCLKAARAQGAAAEMPAPPAAEAERLKADPFWRPEPET